MKNLLKSSFILLAVASMTFLASCGEEDVEEPIDAPTLSVTSAASAYALDEVISFTVTYTTPGQFGGFNYSFTATDGETPVEFTKQLLGPTDLVDEGVDGTATSGSFTFKPFGDVAIEDLEFTVNDEDYSLAGKDVEFDFEILNASVDGLSATASATFSVDEPASPEARSYTAILLAAPLQDANGTTASKTSETFFSTNTGLTYSMATINSSSDPLSANIDFGYFYGSGSNATGATLSDPASYPFAYGQAAWGVRNSTTFRRTSLDASAFAEVTTFAAIDEAFDAADAADSDAGIESGLEAGEVLAFETDADKEGGSKRGLILVNSIVAGDGENGQISIEVLVQEDAE